jgi:hypothetical protein
MMNEPLIIGLSAFAVILAGAVTGWKLRKQLPPEHLTEETKSLISLSTAVVATVSALVLGLLISNANSSFIRLGGQVTALSAEILRLDQILRRYGPDTHVARKTLRQLLNKRLPICSPINQQMCASAIRRLTNCSSSSRICCLR